MLCRVLIPLRRDRRDEHGQIVLRSGEPVIEEIPAGELVDATEAELRADRLRRYPQLRTVEDEHRRRQADDQRRQEMTDRGEVEIEDRTLDAILQEQTQGGLSALSFDEAWKAATGYELSLEY